MNALRNWVERLGRLPVAPLIGYPGARLTGTTLRENLFDAETHTNSLRAIASRWHPDILLPMMDLSVEAAALGLSVRFPDNESPTVEEHPVRRLADLERFAATDILADPRLQAFLHTISDLADREEASLGAYVVGPFTLAGLLMGANEAAIATIRNPDLVHEVLQFSTQVSRSYAYACVEAGADLVVILEPTAVLLSPMAFSEFSGQYVQSIASGCAALSVLHICGDTSALLDGMCETGVHGLSLDSVVDFGAAVKNVPESVVLIGNIDPVRVMGAADPSVVTGAVRDLIEAVNGHKNFILSTGCDLPLETPLENIDKLIDTARPARSVGEKKDRNLQGEK